MMTRPPTLLLPSMDDSPASGGASSAAAAAAVLQDLSSPCTPARLSYNRQATHNHRRSSSWSSRSEDAVEGGGREEAEAAEEEAAEAAVVRPVALNVRRKGAEGRLRLDLAELSGGGGGRRRREEAAVDREAWERRERMEELDKECTEVLPYLYVGSKAVAGKARVLHSCRITHIVNCGGEGCPNYFPAEFAYKRIWLRDSADEDILCILYDVMDFIEQAREVSHGRILLHCQKGISRSPTLAIAYLMWRLSLSFEAALRRLQRLRGVVSPNMGFAAQLMDWQRRLLLPSSASSAASAASSDDDIRLYRIAPHSPRSPLYLVPKLLPPPSSSFIHSLDSRGAFLASISRVLYIWRGAHCDADMLRAAGRAAFQLVRYERALGPPAHLVPEGCESPLLLRALCKASSSSCEEEAAAAAARLRNIERYGKRQVCEYDSDFEMYSKAKRGGHGSVCERRR